MDKTTRLIGWQRITIGLLFLTAVVMAFSGGLQSRRQYRSEARYLRERWIASTGKLELEAATKERIIADLDARLKQYEARYGEIQPVRKGESVYIGKLNGNILVYPPGDKRRRRTGRCANCSAVRRMD